MTSTLIKSGRNPQPRSGESPNPIVAGFAAVFNVLSQPRRDPKTGETFRLRFLPGCFAETLQRDEDISICVDHDELKMISETRRGNVLLTETDKGLWFEVDLENSFQCRQVMRYLRIGNLCHASISFTNGETRRIRENGELIEEHISIRRLKDVSILDNPAFPQTRVELIQSRTPAVQNRRLEFLKSTLLMDN